MNKRSIIINGVKAAEFDLVKKCGRNILNDLVMIKAVSIDSLVPHYRPHFKLEHKRYKFKYKLNDKQIMWRGFFIYSDSRIVKIYIDSKNNHLVI